MQKTQAGWVGILVFSLFAWTVSNLDQSLFGYAIPGIITEFGIGLDQIGLILSVGFIVAAVIFGILGGLIEFAVRLSSNWYFRFGSMFAVLAGFMVIWSNMAVGMIGNEDNPTNLWFGAVLLIAIVGSIASRFRRRILQQAMLVAGIVQISIGVFAGILGSDAHGGRFTIVLSVAWLISSLLFWLADRSARTKS